MAAELERHHADSFGWALSCCGGDRMEADDVLQVAYLKILEGRAKFGGRSDFKTWLFGVIRRTAAERRRRSAVHRLLLLRWLDGRPGARSAGADPDEGFNRLASSERLRSALRALPRRQREVLHLVFYQDLSIREASEVLGISVGAGRRHYERGKHRLRQMLAGC